jgi:acyl-coenzyme A thioesterase PaaI-like protein
MPDLRSLYDRLKTLPQGRRIFDLIAKLYVPHTARMGFRLESLTGTEIRVSMPDRRSNRNHLSSLHAMALAHLGEFTSGVLLLYAVAPDGYRTILVSYSMEYLAKARGRVTASATFKRPRGSLDKKNVPVTVTIVDGKGVVVARAKAVWRVGKIP